MITKATAYRAWPLYILFKCDVRHRLHCFVCTDTHLFSFMKGKTDLVNQRWRRTTCLQHQCYDVGCYPCYPCFNILQTSRYEDWKLKSIFLISKPKHILWVLKRTISMRRSFEHPKHMLKLKDMKYLQFYAQFYYRPPDKSTLIENYFSYF